MTELAEGPWTADVDDHPEGDPAAALQAQLTAAFGAAFTLFNSDAQAARTDLYGLSASKVGGCTREAAYRLAHTPPTNPELATGEKRQTALGTMAHTGLLPVLARALGGDAAYEVATELVAGPDRIPGHADLIWRKVLVDLKTLHQAKLNRVAKSLPTYREHRIQAGVYALGAIQKGIPIEWVAFAYMDRESGKERIVVHPFTPAYILEVVDRVREIQRWREAPDDAPREGPMFACLECPWQVRCMGEPLEPIARTAPPPVYDDPEVAAWLRRYDEATAQETQLGKDKDFYRLIIEHSPPGVYGHLEWFTGDDTTVDDPKKAVELLRSLGFDVPQKRRKGSFRVTAATTPEAKKAAKRRRAAKADQK